MANRYDVIVVGARCAGSPTAMLLARRGYRVLLVDRASFPSDTVSTHVLHPLGVAALERWGLLDRFTATGCPPIRTYGYDFGAFTMAGVPGTADHPVAYCPRRTILDQFLIDAAVEAGAEFREAFTVDALTWSDGRVTGVEGHDAGGRYTESATVVIGADGRNSRVAKLVEAEAYHEKPPILAAYFAYWSDLPMDGRFETYVRPARGFAAAQTHDGLTCVIVGWPYAEFAANKDDIEGHYRAAIALAPAFADRLAGARRETAFKGAAVPNYYRKPYGPGWALVGDAGYNKDFITGQGIKDAFLDAERVAVALDRSFSGPLGFDAAMEETRQIRDEHTRAMFDFTCMLATLEPPPPEFAQLLAASAGNQRAMDDFARVNAGTISPRAFFAPDNVAAIMAPAPTPV